MQNRTAKRAKRTEERRRRVAYVLLRAGRQIISPNRRPSFNHRFLRVRYEIVFPDYHKNPDTQEDLHMYSIHEKAWLEQSVFTSIRFSSDPHMIMSQYNARDFVPTFAVREKIE